MSDSTSHTHKHEHSPKIIPTAETSGITRLSKTDSESEGAHLKRVADELSGSGEERIKHLQGMLSSRIMNERVSAAQDLGKIGSLRAIQLLRDLLATTDEASWRIAIHGLRTGGSREGWLCLEGVALDDANQLGSDNERVSDESFRRLMAMGRTKMMDRLFRASDGHSRSIPGEVAKLFSKKAVETLPELSRSVMALRLGISNGSSATPADTAEALGIDLTDVRALEMQGWQSIHSPLAPLAP